MHGFVDRRILKTSSSPPDTLGMTWGTVERGTADHVQAVSAILEQIDSLAASQDERWAEKRRTPRRKFPTDCEVLHVAQGNQGPCLTFGHTRDISVGGLGFVSSKHFVRGQALFVVIGLPDGKSRELTGTVAYCRRIEDGWYLSGLQFCRIEEPLLSRQAYEQARARLNERASQTSQPETEAKTDASASTTSRHEKALNMLAALGKQPLRSPEVVAKVVAMSMWPNHMVRRATIPVLMQITNRDGIAVLIRLLEDSNASVQAEAAEALAQLRVSEAIQPLRVLLQHSDDEVALRAAAALGRLGDTSGVRVIGRVLHTDSHLSRRAAYTLGIVVGKKFRANAEGVAEAREYLKQHR